MKLIARNIIRSFVFIFLFSNAWQAAHALDTTFTNQYSGNFNGGATDTLYHGGSKFILIAVDDIATPIKTGEPSYDFAIVDGDTGEEKYYGGYQLGQYNLNKDNYNLYIGDFNDDNLDDLLFQAKSTSLKHYIIYANPTGTFFDVDDKGTAVDYYPIIKEWNDGYLGITWSSVGISITDFDGDGKDDIKVVTSSSSSEQIATNITYGSSSTTTKYVSQADNGALIVADSSTTYSAGTLNYDETAMAVGNTSGAFSVAPGGSASYSMSVIVPPGVGDMQPSLGINVASTGGNGSLGIGGGLSGLSVIHRCPQTYAQDGANRGIKFDANDRLCLDGQRLVAVNGTSYGTADSLYRTEQDSFSRIQLKGGSLTSANAYFVVNTKAGQTFYYGADDISGSNSQWSRVHLTTNGTGAVKSWSVGQIIDASGINTLTYHYAGNGLSDHRLSQIDYTTVGGTNAEVLFNYESRADVAYAYIGGKRVTNSKRLKNITTQESSITVRSYKLLYQYSGSSKRSRLTYLLECGADEAATDNCKRPVQLAWSDSNPNPLSYSDSYTNVSSITTQSAAAEQIFGRTVFDRGYCASWDYPGAPQDENYDWAVCHGEDARNNIMYGDIDGDSYTDMCYQSPQVNGTSNVGVVCAFGSANGLYGNQKILTDVCISMNCIYSTMALMDVNGDGLSDIIYRHINNGITVHFSNGAARGFTAANSSSKLPYSIEPSGPNSAYEGERNTLFYPDLNGDGRADICLQPRNYKIDQDAESSFTNPAMQCFINNNTGKTFTSFTAFNSSFTCPTGCQFSSISIQDLNGDGNADLSYRTTAGGLAVRINTGTTFGSASQQGICIYGDTTYGCNDADNHESISYADVTGDGLADLCYRSDSGVQCIPGTGNGFDTAHIIATDICENGVDNGCLNSTVSFPDVNGDGKADISLVKIGEGIKVYLSTGSGFEYLDTHKSCGITSGSIQLTYLCDSATDNMHTVRFIDLNGDGLADLSFRGDNGLHTFISNSATAKAPDMLTAITDGLGNQTTINYARLNDASAAVYSEESCAATPAYPEVCINGPMYVVADYTASNGIGGSSTYSYQYADLKTHLRGRGMLGFGKLVHIDANSSNKVTTTTFNNTGVNTGIDSFIDLYPYAGMPTTNTTVVDGVTIQTVSNDIDAYGTLSSTGSIATPYFSYFSQSTENNFEFNSPATAVTTVVTQNEFDQDGVGNYLAASERHGNLTRNITVTTDVAKAETFTKTTDSVYSDNETLWHLGRVTRTTVKHETSTTGLGGSVISAISRISEFSYDPIKGWLTQSIEEPNDPEYELTTTYTYDDGGYGNKAKITKSVPVNATYPVTARTSESYYSDSNGTKQAAASVWLTSINDLGQSETKTIDPRYGAPVHLVGPNLLETTWTYDHLGRKLAEYRADGSQTQSSLAWCNSCNTEAPNAVYTITTTGTGSAPVTTYFDRLDREVLIKSEDINGNTIYTKTTYDDKGRKVSVTLPFYLNETPILAQDLTAADAFDTLGRVVKVIDASGNMIESTYAGLTSTIKTTSLATINTSGVTHIREVSTTNYANGKKRTTTDTAGNSNAYYYDAVGNLAAVVAPGSTTTMTYDAKGRYKIAMNDADMGAWQYEYDAFGQLRKQIDAKSVSSTFEYDKLGRKILAVEPEGYNLWIYDTATGKGKGKLHKVIGPVSMTATDVTNFLATPETFNTATLETNANFVQTVNYDDLGRATKTTNKLDGSANDSDTAYFHDSASGDPEFMNLDNLGRVARVLYPARDHDQKRVGLTYNYSKSINGEVFLSSVQRHDYYLDGTTGKWTIVQPDPATTIWQLGQDGDFSSAVNKRGQITQSKLGNGLITNRNFDAVTGLLQHIGTGTSGSPVSVQDVEYVFDSLGNLEQRKDYLLRNWNGTGTDLTEQFGYDIMNRLIEVKVSGIAASIQTLTYSADGNILTNSRLGSYVYDPNRPHAVTQVVDGVGNPITGHTYTYDANGNMATRGSDSVVYTSYNKPKSIGKGGNLVTIEYGANHSRFKKVVNMSEVTYYLPQLDKITEGSVTKYVHYLYAGDTLIGTHQVESTAARQTRYFHTDHLGSIAVITNEFGTVMERRSYSAFGEAQPVVQAQNTDLSFNITAAFASATVEGTESTHGFTGHEMLDKVGLIHMNGRVYDPVLARFLSADPNVQFPHSTQGFNRYTYVNNNPLSFTDPSGYFLSGLRKFTRKYARTAVTIGFSVAMMYTGQQLLLSETLAWGPVTAETMAVANVQGAMLGGALSGFMMGGPKGMISGAISGGAFGALGNELHSGNYKWYEEAFSHGVVGGMLEGMQGGNARNGFVANFVGKAITAKTRGKGYSDFERGVVVALSGGISAHLGGGKFENGAISAAMGYLFNELTDAEADDDEYFVGGGTSLEQEYTSEQLWAAASVAVLPIAIEEMVLAKLWSFAAQTTIGVRIGVWAKGVWVSVRGGKDVTKNVDELKYAPRVRARGVEDPKSHNFPYSFDKEILKTKPDIKHNGYKIYQKEGTMTGKTVTDSKIGVRTQQYKKGVYEIGVRKDGVIDHRFFRTTD